MRPALKAGLLPVWRDSDTIQFGVDPRRAVALTGMAGLAVVIGLLDGSRDQAQVVRAAAEHGIPAAATERVLALLAAGGALDDFPAGMLRLVSEPLRARLASELATASLARGDCDGGARTLARRLAAMVTIHGAGRIGRGIGDILATSGVGHVSYADSKSPLPLSPDTSSLPDKPSVPGQLPDLAILAGHHPPEVRAGLMRHRTPHLAVSASEAIGAVGPLVLPGRTTCLRCIDLARTDRDPAWPRILAQQAGRAGGLRGCDAPLAAAVAAQAAAQALAFVDRGPAACGTVNGTLELVLPAWQWRRRTWPPHPDCTCASNPARWRRMGS